MIGHRLGPLSNLLFTTRGRRSGRSRTTALTHVQSEGLLGLLASNFGSRTAPHWYLNLQEYPEARVQLKRKQWLVRARPATSEEHERLWTAALVIWPAWARYAERVRHEVPIVVLVPSAS